MYYKSKLTDNIYNENYEIIVMDERLQPCQDWLAWRLNGGIETLFDGTREDFEQEKLKEIELLNAETNSLLSKTDYFFIRELDESSVFKAVPQWVKDERLKIRQSHYEKEQIIIQKYIKLIG